MEKRGETRGQRKYLRMALYGLMGAVLLFGLLLLAAALGDRYAAIMEWKVPAAKGCLLFSAFLCALFAGNGAGQGKLLHALCAEGVLLAVLVAFAMATRCDARLVSAAIDLLLVLFGAFAGTALPGRRHSKRRGKR